MVFRLVAAETAHLPGNASARNPCPVFTLWHSGNQRPVRHLCPRVRIHAASRASSGVLARRLPFETCIMTMGCHPNASMAASRVTFVHTTRGKRTPACPHAQIHSVHDGTHARFGGIYLGPVPKRLIRWTAPRFSTPWPWEPWWHSRCTLAFCSCDRWCFVSPVDILEGRCSPAPPVRWCPASWRESCEAYSLLEPSGGCGPDHSSIRQFFRRASRSNRGK